MGISCDTCVNALLMDFGYSNYTVEGTEFHCMLRLHPDGAFDRFYGSDERLKFAAECPSYVEGYPDTLDVDGELRDELSQQAWDYLELGPERSGRWVSGGA